MAATAFSEFGYHSVGIDDIAAEVGITSGAVYKHFANKQQLLGYVVLHAMDLLDAAIIDNEPVARHALDSSIRSVIQLLYERRSLSLLLQRESRHLDATTLTQLGTRVGTVFARFKNLLQVTRPELGDNDAFRLVRCVFAVLASPAYHAIVLPRKRAEALLYGMATAILTSTALPRESSDASTLDSHDFTFRTRPVSTDNHLVPRASRREMLVTAAISLFADNSFQGVSMEDIGAAVGIRGPSIYRYFPSKTALLDAVLTRGAEWLQLGLSDALASGKTSKEKLERLLRSYVTFVLGNADLTSLMLREQVAPPDTYRRVHDDYLPEWARLILALRPELTESEAIFLTHGVVGMVDDNARSTTMTIPADLDDILVEIGLEILLRAT
ncbi:TetR/AcrR family transcriptional regulator [Nocardia sp. SC052]|uniref:TetR/AcrR family transcriptional regulator n=1 Tax=Nocardia sichangensis TaxID=3385975 RepID=UPI00399F5685